MLLDPDESQLVLVDFQQRLVPALHDAQAVVSNAVRLASLARLFAVPVWTTEQNPEGLGDTIPELKGLSGTVIAKMSFSAAHDLLPRLRPAPRPGAGNARSLPKHLQKQAQELPQRGAVVLAGCEAHVCLMQTALHLLEAEFEVWVVTDACASRTERNRDAAFDRLAGAGCELVTTEMVAFEWLGCAEHEAFREVLRLVK